MAPMLASINIRCWGRWLLGLFLLAQGVGILPLTAVHLQHAFASEQDIAADLKETGRVSHPHQHHAHHGQGEHDHGAADATDQCCTLHHHLAGVVSVWASTGVTAAPQHAAPHPVPRLESADQRSLERPPKFSSSI